MRKKILITVMCLLAATAVFANTSSAEHHEDYKHGTITVTGNASDSYPPDTVEIVLAVETTERTVAEATRKNNISSEKVVTTLKKLLKQDEGDTIKTSSYSLQPVYEYDEHARKNRFTGYRVTNQVTLRSKQIDNAGTFIDTATQQGANRVDTINFILSSDREYCARLIREATEKARANADLVAQTLGTKIIGVRDVSPSCGGEMPRPMYRYSMAREEAAADAASAPVEAGTLILRASVSAVFYIDNP